MAPPGVMSFTLLGIIMAFSPLQSRKTDDKFNEVTPLGIVKEVSALHPLKAPMSMYVTLLGIVIEFKPVQSRKAYPPIEVTPLGIVTEIKLL